MKERKCLTMEVKELLGLVRFALDNKSPLIEYAKDIKKQKLPTMDVYFKRVSAKAPQTTTMKINYIEDKNLTILSGIYAGTTGCLIAFRYGEMNNLKSFSEHVYVGFYIKGLYSAKRETEIIPMVFYLNDTFIKEFEDISPIWMTHTLDLMGKYINDINDINNTPNVDTIPSVDIKPKENPYTLIEKRFRTKTNQVSGYMEQVSDIDYLLEMAYVYHITGIHNHYITKDAMQYYAPQITKLSEREYDLLNHFLEVAFEHAKEYNVFEEVK